MWRSKWGCSLNPQIALYLSHKALKPRSVKRSPFADEHLTRLNWWASFEVDEPGPCRAGKAMGTDRCLLPLPITKRDRAASLADHQVMEVQFNQVADPTARVQHDGEDRRRPNVVSEFDLTQQLPHLGPVQSFWGQRRPFQFLDRLGGIGGDMAMFGQPAEEPDGSWSGSG